jgi:hypothetical protein
MDLQLRVPARRLLRGLLTTALGLNAVGLVVRAGKPFLGGSESDLVRLFDVSEEANVPSWFSSVLLLICAMVLASIAREKRRSGRYGRHWTALAIIFLYLSVDEAAKIHELLIEPVRATFSVTGAFYYAWVIVAIPMCAVLAVVFAPFLRSLPPETARRFILAAVLYVGGALGLEMLGGSFEGSTLRGWSLVGIAVTVEELLENLGVIVFLAALTSYAASETDLERVFSAPPPSATGRSPEAVPRGNVGPSPAV